MKENHKTKVKNSVVIIGASGHGKVVADIIQSCGDAVIGFLDDNKIVSETFNDFPVLGAVQDFKKFSNKSSFLIAIGNPEIREQISNELTGVTWDTAIHPSAVISKNSVKIGEGTVVMANAVVNLCSTIGRHCIINSGAIIEHDNKIEDFVHISVGAKLAGTVSVGKGSWIGIGASVSNNVTICSNCTVGAGAVVVKDIKEPGTYVGVPARKINSMRQAEKRKNMLGGGIPSI